MAGYDNLMYGSAVPTSLGPSNTPGTDGVLPGDERLVARKEGERGMVEVAVAP